MYRWYEMISVYRMTINEVIHEEFGRRYHERIDFSMDIQHLQDPEGDRVDVVLSSEFLPYQTY